MSQNKKYRRRQLLVSPEFQFSLISFLLIISSISVGIFYSANRYFLYRLRESAMALGILPSDQVIALMNEAVPFMNKTFLVATLVTLGLVFFTGLILSHRVAGPLYHLCRHMKETMDGKNPGILRFRRNDYFHDIADLYNELTKAKSKK